MEKLGMYKQRLIIQLITTLLITLTVISLIEIYWFSLGIYSYIVTAIILFFQFLVSHNHLQKIKTDQEKNAGKGRE